MSLFECMGFSFTPEVDLHGAAWTSDAQELPRRDCSLQHHLLSRLAHRRVHQVHTGHRRDTQSTRKYDYHTCEDAQSICKYKVKKLKWGLPEASGMGANFSRSGIHFPTYSAENCSLVSWYSFHRPHRDDGRDTRQVEASCSVSASRRWHCVDVGERGSGLDGVCSSAAASFEGRPSNRRAH